MKLLIPALLLPLSLWANQTRTGLYYDVGTKTDKPRFTQVTEYQVSGDSTKTKSRITDAAGQVVMTETSLIENGHIVSQVMEQLQLRERYELHVESGEATFITFKGAKKDSENKVKVDEGFATGPSLEYFLRPLLKKGFEGAEVSFGIFELQKPVAFSIRTSDKIFTDLKNSVALKMKVSSFLYSFFSDPIYLEVDPESAALLRYRGRTPVRVLTDGKLKPYDADIYYEIAK